MTLASCYYGTDSTMRDHCGTYFDSLYPTFGYTAANDTTLRLLLAQAREGIERSQALLRRPIYPWLPRGGGAGQSPPGR